MFTTADHEPHEATPAETGRFLAEYNRRKAARHEAWQALYQAQEDARRRLAERYGSDREKRWIADPNMPQVDAVSLMYAFLHKGCPASVQSPEMQQTPKLEREDAVAAAYMIRAARYDARQREIAVIRQILTHSVTWDDLAHALDTTAEDLKDGLRQQGQQPDTWTVSADGDSNRQSHPVSPTREQSGAALAALTGEHHPIAQQNGGDSHVGHP